MWRVSLELEVRGLAEMALDCGPCKDSQRDKQFLDRKACGGVSEVRRGRGIIPWVFSCQG